MTLLPTGIVVSGDQERSGPISVPSRTRSGSSNSSSPSQQIFQAIGPFLERSAPEVYHPLQRQLVQDQFPWTAALANLNPHQTLSLRETLGTGTLARLQYLSHETDPTLLTAGIFHLAQQAQHDRQYPLASALYGFVAQSDNSHFASQSRARLELLSGGGSWQERAAFLSGELVYQVTDPGLLGGMLIGQGFFGLGRAWALGRFGNQTLRARGLAQLAGLALEVPAFTFSIRGIHELMGHHQDWSGAAIRRDLLATGLMLSSLRSTGALGRLAMERLPAGEFALRPVLERAIPQAATFSGIYGSFHLEAAFGLRELPRGDVLMVESLSTLLHFNLAGHLLQSAPRPFPHMAPRERSLTRPSTPPEGSRGLRAGISRLFASPQEHWVTPEGIRVHQGWMEMKMHKGGPSPSEPPRRTESEPRTEESGRISQVQPIEVPSLVRAELGRIEGELWKVKWQNEQNSRWLEISHRATQELKTEVQRYRDYVQEHDPDSMWLREYPRLLKELERIHGSLSNLRLGQATQPHSGPSFNNPEVQSFWDNFYRFPNNMINFIHDPHSMDFPVAHLVRARQAAKALAEGGFENTGPLFSAEFTHSLKTQSQEIGAEMIRLYRSLEVADEGLNQAPVTPNDFANVVHVEKMAHGSGTIRVRTDHPDNSFPLPSASGAAEGAPTHFAKGTNPRVLLWEDAALGHTRSFQDLLRNTLSHMQENPRYRDKIDGMEQAVGQTEQILDRLDRRLDYIGDLVRDGHAYRNQGRNFLSFLYRSPMHFGDFLAEGQSFELRATNYHLGEALRHLEEPTGE